MLTLQKITEDNFKACIELSVTDSQKNFVANNTYSLAQAWLYPDDTEPFVVCLDGEPVGFVMCDVDFRRDGSRKTFELWRFMIDGKHQGKGYGKAAMQLIIDYARGAYDPDDMRLSVVPDNKIAYNLYKNFGFIPTGEFDYGEAVMVLDLRESR